MKAISIALTISLIMHIGVMRVLPWLETVKYKPPLTIIAELKTLLPPPPQSVQSQPTEPLIKPEVVKVEPKPTLKPQAMATPVLATERADKSPDNYAVPETAKAVTTPTESAAPAMVEAIAAPQQQAAAASSKHEAMASASTSTWDDSELWDEYGRNLQKMVERNKQYPAIAVRRNWQGLVKVIVRFSVDGKPLSVLIEKTSGQKVLDEQALEMVKKSLNDLPTPNKFKGREFKLTIPVDFKLE